MELTKRILSMAFLALLSTSAFIGCSDDESAPQPVATSYYLENGICYNNLNQQVDINRCPNTNTNNGNYRLIGGQCYDLNNRPVSLSYCQTNNNSGGYQLIGNICYNQYGQQVSTTLCQGSSNNGNCSSSEVNVPGYGCLPRGNCGSGYVSWGGYCHYLGY